LKESSQDRFKRKLLTKQNLGVILMELLKKTDAGEEGSYFFKLPLFYLDLWPRDGIK
jgi:hypothetical protein